MSETEENAEAGSSTVGEESGQRSLFPPADTLKRTALQKQLKEWGVRALGTTVELKERYEAERCKRDIVVSQSVSGNTTVQADVNPNEKRRRPFRATCPEPIRQRIERAKTQRLYLIQRGEIEGGTKCEFAVLGSTGNIYNVTISHMPKCSCPDFTRAHSNSCKHILFVLLKVMAIDDKSPYLYQAAWLTSELQHMFANFVERRGPGNSNNNHDNAVLANDKVRQAYAKIQAGESLEDEDKEDEKNSSGIARKSLDDDNADCPICFDSMLDDPPTKLTYCRTACGTNFHIDCIRRWCEQQQRSTSAPATCPNCRQPWEVKGKTTGMDKTTGGYTNLGQLQGQSPERDVSTYYEWNSSRKRRR